MQVVENKREDENKWGAFDSPCTAPVLGFRAKRAKSGTHYKPKLSCFCGKSKGK